MFYPDLITVKELSQSYNVIPVFLEMYADTETPISLFKRFKDSSYCFLLESVENGTNWGRYSFIGKSPFLIVRSKGGKTLKEYKEGNKIEIEGNPVNIMEEIMQEFKSCHIEGFPRFCGGAVGYFGYDIARYKNDFQRALNTKQKDDLGLPESHFMIADEILAFDHLKQSIYIIVNLHVNGNVERSYNTAVDRIKELQKDIKSNSWKAKDIHLTKLSKSFTKNKERISGCEEKLLHNCANLSISSNTDMNLNISSNTDMKQFCENVEMAKNCIQKGELKQVVISQRLSVDIEEDPLNVYRALRIINPSPYMYYLKFDDYLIAGSSPEMLARVEDGIIETRPIAGTRKRGKNEEDDKLLEIELLSNKKEVLEHEMLVESSKKDIEKITKPCTLEMKNPMHIEKFSHVMHIVTNIQGELRDNKTSFDGLMSVFPAGTLSGEPKLRAMEIIDQLESIKRGPYGGAVCYISFNGNLDSCIIIRTVFFKGKKAYIQAGAGIVSGSVPEKEYEESLNKAQALIDSIIKAGEIQ